MFNPKEVTCVAKCCYVHFVNMIFSFFFNYLLTLSTTVKVDRCLYFYPFLVRGRLMLNSKYPCIVFLLYVTFCISIRISNTNKKVNSAKKMKIKFLWGMRQGKYLPQTSQKNHFQGPFHRLRIHSLLQFTFLGL